MIMGCLKPLTLHWTGAQPAGLTRTRNRPRSKNRCVHINKELTAIVEQEGSFATAVCGLVDLNKNVFRFASAGGPEIVLTHEIGKYECLTSAGLPLDLMSDANYEEFSTEFHQGNKIKVSILNVQ